jgi:hypothetical protein
LLGDGDVEDESATLVRGVGGAMENGFPFEDVVFIGDEFYAGGGGGGGGGCGGGGGFAGFFELLLYDVWGRRRGECV